MGTGLVLLIATVLVSRTHPHIARNEDFAERFEREAGLGLK